MKKTLMAGTALVASGVLLAAATGTASAQAKKAEKIKLGLGGYMEQWFGWSDQDLEGFGDLDQKSDSEIYISGSTVLDNGIRFGVKWEIEGDGSPDAPANTGSDRFDEASLFMSGSFGRLQMGEDDVASEVMGYGPSTVGPIGTNKTDANDDWMINNGSTNLTHNMDLGMSDKHSISYFSPRVAGFQFGVSYVPQANLNTSQDANLETSMEHNGFSSAVNYVNKFGDVSVAAYVGAATKEVSDSNAGRIPDSSGWGTGFSLGYGGFTLGASYISENEAKTADTFSVGGRYKAGMNAFSLAYLHAENRVSAFDAGPSNDEADLVTAGYERTLGPGVTWGSSIAYADYSVGGAPSGNSLDNSGLIVVTGIKLDF